MSNDLVTYTCTLDEKNSCPFRKEDNSCAGIDTKCGFMQKVEIEEEAPKEYVRKPRWYEQYYNGTKKQGLDIIKRN